MIQKSAGQIRTASINSVDMTANRKSADSNPISSVQMECATIQKFAKTLTNALKEPIFATSIRTVSTQMAVTNVTAKLDTNWTLPLVLVLI